MKQVLNWDISIFKYINNRLKCSFLDIVMPRLTHLGGVRFSIAGCLFILCFFRRSALGLETLFAMIGSHLIVQVVKRFCSRRRPYLSISGTKIWEALVLKDYSFPSGHTTASFSLAATLAINFPVIAPLIMGLAFLVGISRIYLGLHYPSDILIGAALGTVSAFVACL